MLAPFFHVHGGKCAEAIEMYQKAFNAEVHHISRYRDEPGYAEDGTGNGDLIMHAAVTLLGCRVDMCDHDEGPPATGNNLSLSAYFYADGDVCRAFDALKEGAAVEQEPQPEFWSTMYARLVDRYGIMWHLMVK
jgi:PhnB protein